MFVDPKAPGPNGAAILVAGRRAIKTSRLPQKNWGACVSHRAPKVVARGDFWEEVLSRVVHLVFDRVGGVFEADHLGHLQLDIAVDEIVVEHAAGLEERAVLVETAERVTQ
jgi:hypothetical protein